MEPEYNKTVEADRPLHAREAEVIRFLAGALPDGGSIERQLPYARVIGETSCCATVSLDVHEAGEAESPEVDSVGSDAEPVTYVEAGLPKTPDFSVRLVVAAGSWIERLELVHPRDTIGPMEFPPLSALAAPTTRRVSRSEATGRSYSERIYFPAAWYDDVMARLAEDLPAFVSLSFNFTDDTPTSDCWIELNRKLTDPEIDLNQLLRDVVAEVAPSPP